MYFGMYRYKALCPDTWPNWKGSPAEGVKSLVKHLGYKPNEYRMGRYSITRFIIKCRLIYNVHSSGWTFFSFKQDQDLHSSPANPVCHWRCIWSLSTWTGWGFYMLQTPETTFCFFFLWTCILFFKATRIQAKYKGHKVKEEFLKKREAGINANNFIIHHQLSSSKKCILC